MKNIIVLLLISMLVFGANSCKSNPLWFAFGNIDDESDTAPGRRDYVWTHDTIKVPYTTLSQIWGDATDNLWAVGGTGDLDKTIFHYDGASWKRDVTWRNLRPRCIYGLNKNDIWIGGEGGEIWHYSGGVWSKKYQFKADGYAFLDINNFCGNSKSDIYAVGIAYSLDLKIKRGFILHYDGTGWSPVCFSDTNSGYFICFKDKTQSNNYFLLNLKLNTGTSIDTTTVCEYNNGKLKELYRSLRTDSGDIYFNSINDRIYYSLGDGIYVYVYDRFINLFKVSNPSIFTKGVFGRNSKDLFLTMRDGLAHYNGSNIEYIFRQSSVPVMFYGGMVVLEKDIYLLENSTVGLNIIHHGKLNN